jgi:hypothetical protein
MSFIINPYWYAQACPDADANAFLTATGITDPTISSAVCTLVTSMKANGTWAKCSAIYPMVGGTATTHKFNLKNPADTNAAFRLNFVGGWTHSANGALPNGTNAYANTFLTPSINLTLLNTHLSFYSRTSAIGNSQRDLSAYNDGIFPSFSLGTNTGVLVSDHYWYTTNRISRTIPNAQGLMLTSRTNDTTHKAYRNGVQLGATDTLSNAGKLMPSIPLFLGAANITPQPVSAFSNKQYAFASIGAGLNDTEAANFYTAVQTFQTTLGRQV